MGSSKKQMRQARRMQTRTKNRGGKHTTLSDPATNNINLSAQLRTLGLYAVETLGDGNCLFRALSDQLYGTPNFHLALRTEICDWIEAHKERYEPFVEDERGLEVHLQCMRERGTYGGHLELSACAHLKRRNVKVIQPGLVYVIECDAGDAVSRRRKGKARESDDEDDDGNDDDQSAIYVAYHDWEHFSSVRNLTGPHHGPPSVCETIQPPPSNQRTGIKLRVPGWPRPTGQRPLEQYPDPANIELPRSPSPSSQDSSRLTSTSTSSLVTPDDASEIVHTIRQSHSPKRTLDESSAADGALYSSDKKPKFNAFVDLDDSLSDLSSLPSTPAPDSQPPTPARVQSPTPTSITPSHLRSSNLGERPLTRRQRKALGLPKPRGPTAGTIIIPGGRHPKSQGKPWAVVSEDQASAKSSADELKDDQEWVRNGVGRIDVRGFKELRI